MSQPWYRGTLWHGMSATAWFKLLASHRCAVSPSRLGLALGVTAFSSANSVLSGLEAVAMRKRLAAVPAPKDPLFIMGHWRTGTTMLHEWLDVDAQNRCPSTYECLSPHHFLLTESLARRWMGFVLPRRRPMDNMKVSFDRPQEDEAALCNLGADSQFLMVAFPQHGATGGAYVTLDELTEKQRTRWAKRHQRFLRRLLVARAGRLVLKSPQHTFRLPWLAKIYPNAHFLYLVRHPYDVYPSTVNFWRQMFAAYAMQAPARFGDRDEAIEEYVLATFQQMHQRWEATAAELDPARWTILKYEQLTENPVNVLREVYQRLGWPNFEQLEPQLQQRANVARKFKRNEFELSEADRSRVSERWKEYFQRHDYEP